MTQSKWRTKGDAFIESCFDDFQGQIVLDVGCGNRKFSSPKIRAKIFGLDIQSFPDVDYVCDLEKSWPKDLENVDAILMNNYLEHCFTPKIVLDNSYLTLKSGGMIVLTVPFSFKLHQEPIDFYRYSPFAIIRLLEESGFVDVCLTPLSYMTEVIENNFKEIDKHLVASLVKKEKYKYCPYYIVNRILISSARVMFNYCNKIFSAMEESRPSKNPTITLGYGVVAIKPKE